MRAIKWIVIVLLVYVGIVAVFESLLGYFQPASESTLVITTTGEDGPHDRVVAHLESDGKLYVAANHWPRAWYHQALENPEVRVTIDGDTVDYVAVPVGPEEHARVEADNSLPLMFSILTGFPPRYFVRLDPRPGPG